MVLKLFTWTCANWLGGVANLMPKILHRGMNRLCGNGPEISNFSSECSVFFKKIARGNIDFAWEWHRFRISNSKNAWEWHRFEAKTLESGIVFKLGVSISLKKCIVFELQKTKTLESGIVFKILGPRLPDQGNTPRRRLTWISQSPQPITPRKKNTS